MTSTAASTPGADEVRALRDVAVEVATRAAALVRELRGAPGDVQVADTKTSVVDVVTEVDRRSEELVRELLADLRPDDAILGEEGGETDGTSGVRWVVDPVDGTVNLLYGIPEYAVSVAAEHDGVGVAAAVVDVSSGAVYAAARGQGATKDGVPIRVRPVAPVPQRLVLTGFGYQSDVRAHQGACVARLLPEVRDIRRMGSCALDLCHLAEGLADAYVEDGPRRWDWAAAGLVLTEAGGRFEVLDGPLADVLEGWPRASVLVGAPADGWDDFVALLGRTGFLADHG